MTHIINIESTGDYMETEWFVRSVEALVEASDGNQHHMRRRYEQAYDVKLYFDSLHQVNSIEFKTVEQATEFILRWS